MTASKKPIHDAKEKTPGNKDGQGDKSGKKNDGKGKDEGDGKEEVGKATVALRLSLKLNHRGMGQGHEAPLVFHDVVFGE